MQKFVFRNIQISNAEIIGHVLGILAMLIFSLFFWDQWKPGSWVTLIGLGIWWGIALIVKNALTVRAEKNKKNRIDL